jgi:hypothetical protein
VLGEQVSEADHDFFDDCFFDFELRGQSMDDVLGMLESFVRPLTPFAVLIVEQVLQAIHELVLTALEPTETSLFLLLILVLVQVDLLLVGDMPELDDKTLTTLILAVGNRLLSIEHRSILTIRTGLLDLLIGIHNFIYVIATAGIIAR